MLAETNMCGIASFTTRAGDASNGIRRDAELDRWRFFVVNQRWPRGAWMVEGESARSAESRVRGVLGGAPRAAGLVGSAFSRSELEGRSRGTRQGPWAPHRRVDCDEPSFTPTLATDWSRRELVPAILTELHSFRVLAATSSAFHGTQGTSVAAFSSRAQCSSVTSGGVGRESPSSARSRPSGRIRTRDSGRRVAGPWRHPSGAARVGGIRRHPLQRCPR